MPNNIRIMIKFLSAIFEITKQSSFSYQSTILHTYISLSCSLNSGHLEKYATISQYLNVQVCKPKQEYLIHIIGDLFFMLFQTLYYNDRQETCFICLLFEIRLSLDSQETKFRLSCTQFNI